jgi:hypothetical protein
MKIAELFASLALSFVATACTAERAMSPQPAAPSFANSMAPAAGQVPLLFVVDGIRYAKNQVPSLTPEQVFAVQVIKGHRALEQYGPDASYGVVIITTKQASTPRS